MRTRQRHAAAALGNPLRGAKYESTVFGCGLVGLVLTSFGDPLIYARRLAEEHSRLAPLEADEPTRRLLDYFNLHDAADELRSSRDIRNRGPDRFPRSIDD